MLPVLKREGKSRATPVLAVVVVLVFAPFAFATPPTIQIPRIDTFHDARRGYAFAANPFGIQWDALWTEGSIRNNTPADYSGFDTSFDTVWRSEGRLTGRGYILLMAIPFKSLRFPNTDQQEWGIILNRAIPRTNENLFWPRVSVRIQGRFNQAATATGL